VTALAALSGHTVAQAMDKTRKFLGKSKRWRGGLIMREIVSLLDLFDLQYRYRLIDRMGRDMPVKPGTIFRRAADGLTLTRFHKQHAERGKAYLVIVTGHAIVYQNGRVFDQHCDGASVAFSGLSRKRVRCVFEIQE
jgi:hypothetical protein